MKSQSKFAALRGSFESVSELSEKLKAAEVATVSAKEALKKAGEDDGVITPAKLVDNISSAERQLQIRIVEANRIAAKLGEEEEKCRRETDEFLEEVTLSLEERAKEEIEFIRKSLAPIVGEDACQKQEFLDFVEVAGPVVSRKDYAYEIWSLSRRGTIFGKEPGRIDLVLTEKVLGAEALLLGKQGEVSIAAAGEPAA